MKILFLGCGGAFDTENLQSNMIVEAASGKKLLVDCGGFAPFAFQRAGIKPTDIDATFVTHQHADHVGGYEWLGFVNFFTPGAKRPTMFGSLTMLRNLWEKSLSGGMQSYEGQPCTLDTYFVPQPVRSNEPFYWEGIKFQPFKTVHVMDGYELMESYGLLIREDKDDAPTIMISGDTQFAPSQLTARYNDADVIFHDCETYPFHSGVHAHIEKLATLSEEIREKMWCYHYGPHHKLMEGDTFKGFVQCGEVFSF